VTSIAPPASRIKGAAASGTWLDEDRTDVEAALWGNPPPAALSLLGRLDAVPHGLQGTRFLSQWPPPSHTRSSQSV